MRKVIMLDIDGVLNSYRSVIAYGQYPITNTSYEYFDMVAVGMIHTACKKCNAEIILSSTWRYDQTWKNLIKTLNLPIVDRTPVSLSGNRKDEIETWLKDNIVFEYVIVDDIDLAMHNLVKVDPKNGFSFENYEQVLDILGVENNE